MLGWEIDAMMAPHLKVVHPADPPSEPLPTLRDIWREVLQPRKRREGIKRDTEAFYRRALDAWDGFLQSSPPGGPTRLTQCQALSQINAQALQAYQDYLVEQQTGARTTNLHVMCIHSILKAHAEQSGVHGVPARPPELKEGKAPKLYFSREDVSALYEACEIAIWPQRGAEGSLLTYAPAAGWRFLICWWFNYGMRTQELYGHKPDARPILWRQTTWEQVNPSEAGQAVSDHGWLWYTPPKQERHKDDDLVLPLTRITRAHLESIRPTHGADEGRPLLYWPRGYDQFRRQWHAIVEAAGVQAKPNLKTGKRPKLLPKHFRKTATTWLNVHRRGIAKYIVGHAEERAADSKVIAGGESEVSETYYDNQENAVLEALTSFPQPTAFERVFHAARPRQLRLF